MKHAYLASPKGPVPLFSGMSKRLSNIVVTMAILTAGAARADLFFPSDATNFTSTLAVIETTTNTTVARTLQSFKTQLDFGFAGGPALSQQTFLVAVSDPAFQAAIIAAVMTLVSNGAVSTSGPAQVSSTTSITTEAQTIETARSSTLTSHFGEYVGPASFTSGNRGLCQSSTLVYTTPGLSDNVVPGNTYPLLLGCAGGVPVTIGSGGIVNDILSLTNTAIATTTTTTATNLLFEVYRIDGVSARAVAVPEPSSLAVLAVGLLGLGCARLARPKRM